MAVTIKLKNASGSDPSASDLVVGEVAIRTDTGKLFTKKDDNSVAEISGGGIDDGDKGDITVSNSGATFTIDNSVITSAKIADGAIVNADINGNAAITGNKLADDTIVNAKIDSAAAIAGTKISPDFGSQNIVTSGTGTFNGGDVIIESAAQPSLHLRDSSDNPDYILRNNDGAFIIYDSTNTATRLQVNTDGHIDIAGNTDFGAGIDVTGNIIGSGYLVVGGTSAQASDAVTLMSDGEVTAAGLYFSNNIGSAMNSEGIRRKTTNTIAFDTNSTERMTLNNSGLDVTGNIGVSGTVDGRDLATDGSKLDGIESGATADQTKSDIDGLGIAASTAATLATARNIGGVSFNGSANINLPGVNTGGNQNTSGNAATATALANARTIAGVSFDGTGNISLNNNAITNGAGYITATLTNEQVQDIVGGMVTGNTESGISVTYQDGDGTLDFVVGTLNQNTTGSSASCTGNAATATQLANARTIAGVSFNGTANISLNNNAITNGAGYITSADGGNAATLDGIDSASFARSDASDTMSGDYTFSSSSQDIINFSHNSTNNNRGIAFNSRTAISSANNDGWLRLNNNSEFTSGVYTPLVIRADGGYQVDGTTVINGSAQLIASRLTGSLPAIDGSSLTGISAGATGGGSDECFYENSQTITTNYTITNGKNAMSAGPITINSGVTVTVGSGENWTVV